jgi:hypothetical protein
MGDKECSADTCTMDCSLEKTAFEAMSWAFEQLCLAAPTRENSLAKTKLEEAMMWCNKDRAMKGQLPKSPTHVQAE